MTTATEEQRGHNMSPEGILPTLPAEMTRDDLAEAIQEADAQAVESDLPYDAGTLEVLKVNVSAFCDAAGQWGDLKQINSTEQSERLTDFVTGARQLSKKVDEARKASKAPHDEKATAVQTAFTPLLKKLERVAEGMKAMQGDWLQREQRRIQAEQAAARAEAEAREAEARRLAAEAEARGDVSGAVDAEEEIAAAAKATEAANRVTKTRAGSATGGGRTMALRTQVYAEITNWRAVFMHFEQAPEVKELLQRLADRELRAGGEVVGANRMERSVAA